MAGYCAYLRKSRADEVREKVESGYDALSHHRAALEDLARRMDVVIARWYSDGIRSGDSIASRPEMASLLADVESGMWDGVLCMEVERLTRGDMADQARVGRAFAESGALIVTPRKVYDPRSEADMEYFEFGLFMSRREFKAINKRLVAGREASVREGQWIAKDAPFGYDKKTVDGMKTLVPNSDARFVEAAFEMYANGESYRSIARALGAMGAVPPRSASWNPNSVRNIVNNPAYIGKVRWNATRQTPYREAGRTRTRTMRRDDMMLVDGLHPAIVGDELWDAAQRRTSAAPVRAAYEPRNHYGRILVCAECGKALRWVPSSHGKGPLLVHLHPGEGCQTKGCRVEVLDRVFTESLLAILDDFVVDGVPTSSRRADYERSISDAHAAIEANFDRMERGVITEDDFMRRRGVLESRIADAEAMLDSLPPEDDADRTVMMSECINAVRDPNVSCESKRMLIWGLCERIEYRNRAPQGKDAIELDIHLRS